MTFREKVGEIIGKEGINSITRLKLDELSMDEVRVLEYKLDSNKVEYIGYPFEGGSDDNDNGSLSIRLKRGVDNRDFENEYLAFIGSFKEHFNEIVLIHISDGSEDDLIKSFLVEMHFTPVPLSDGYISLSVYNKEPLYLSDKFASFGGSSENPKSSLIPFGELNWAMDLLEEKYFSLVR